MPRLLPAGRVTLGEHCREGIGFVQFLDVLKAADKDPFHEHHGKGRPAAPHLEGVAAAPFGEVAPVLQVVEGLPLFLKEFADFSDDRVLRHPDDDDGVGGDRRFDFGDDVGAVRRNFLANGGVDSALFEDGSHHDRPP